MKLPKIKIQFSKILTGLVALVMLPVSVDVIDRCLDLAEMAIQMQFSGALPYVTAIVGFVEAAVVIPLACYYDNSKKEKVANAQYGIKKDF